jgi:hypothetical protein
VPDRAHVLVGLRTGYRETDVDEVVYRDTVVAMQDGQGYYPAMREALVAKEGAPPSQIRSVRPPTLYLFLSRFPPGTWRYLVGAVYLATMLLAWRLARTMHPLGGPIAVFLTGMWMVGASPLFFLNTELWGLPLLLAARSRSGTGGGPWPHWPSPLPPWYGRSSSCPC